MSYSFSAKAASKAAVLELVAAELAKVVASQPIHAVDEKQAQATVEAQLGVIPEPSETQDVAVSVSGSVSWVGVYPDSHILVGANVSVSVGLAVKEAAPSA